jgi:hypothetical protein
MSRDGIGLVLATTGVAAVDAVGFAAEDGAVAALVIGSSGAVAGVERLPAQLALTDRRRRFGRRRADGFTSR